VIALGLQLLGIEQAIERTRTARRDISRATLNAARRVVRRRLTRIRQDIRTATGLGVSIWGDSPSGLSKIVSLVRARIEEGRVETGIKLKGLPAIIETGGRLRPHTIRPQYGKFLANPALNFISRGPVRHTGANVRPHGIAQRHADDSLPEILREMDLALNEVASGRG
jgi:hypothetical protein